MKIKVGVIFGGETVEHEVSIISAVQMNPGLQECEPKSIFNAALLGESLNLSPSPQLGQYYLVPFKNSKEGVTKAQMQIGYKGYLHLAIRSGQYKDIDVFEIHEGEFKGRDKETGKFKFEFIENEAERLSKPVIGYMAYLWGISFIPLAGDSSRSASFRFGALLYLIAIIVVSYDLFKDIYPHGLDDQEKEEENIPC